MRIVIILSMSLLTVLGAGAGTLVGTVRAEGKAGADQDSTGSSYQSRKYKFAEKVNYAQMHDFIVYIDQKPAEKAQPPAKPVQIVTQKDATFSPHILPLLVGTTVEWPNNDDIFHNVFSFSEGNSFDLDLYKAPVKKFHEFKNPGRVDVFCSIHSQMHCIILVLENPFFAATDVKGAYRIEGVPAGKYRLKAWHERLPPQIKEISVPEQGEIKVDFVLGIKDLPQQ